MNNGIVGDMAALGITESFSVKRQVRMTQWQCVVLFSPL